MSTTPQPRLDAGNRPGLTLLVVCLGVLIVPLGVSGTPVALPDIGRELGGSLASLQWVVNAYNVMAASLMMVAGSLADLLGRKKMFAFGTGLYAVSLVATVLAPSVLVIDIARGVAGVAAAALMTSATAIVASSFDGAARAKAFAVAGVTLGSGLALGPTTSGLLVGALGWQSVFYAHLALVVLSMLGLPFLRDSRNPEAGGIDWPGTITFSLALVLFTLAIIQGPQNGWASPVVLLLFAGSVALVVVFALVERRQQTPMFDLSLFRESRFLSVNLLNVAFSFGFIGLLLVLPAYLIGANGESSQGAGLIMLLLTGPVLFCPLIGGRLVASGVHMRVVLGLGLLLIAAGCAWLTVVHPGISVLGLAGPLLVAGVGVGLIMGVLDGAAVSTVPPERAGMAAGMFNTIRLASEAIAAVVMVAAVASMVRSRISDGLPEYLGAGAPAGTTADKVASGDVAGVVTEAPARLRDAFTDFLSAGHTDALRVVLWASAALCAITAVVVHQMLTDRGEPAGESAGEPAGKPADADGAPLERTLVDD
ncbi:MFS transporter [Streptomyces scopuliridis]|uniref:MFS transporter n=1 Tax=Streptomyces scopuliridis TaxID=452529 RepID=UPI0036C2C0F8